MVSSTSLTISGSSAEVGSSNSMIFGFMQSARAIATRCCWPPESWPGYFAGLLGDLDALEIVHRDLLGLACLGMLAHPDRRQRQFSSTVRCGNRLKCWNTMPTSRRTSSIFLRSLVELDAVDDDAALLVLLQPVDAADHRRLAGARRPADHDALALGDAQVDVAQHVEIAVPLVHADHVDGDVGFERRGLESRVVGGLLCHRVPSTPVARREAGLDEPRIARHAVAEDRNRRSRRRHSRWCWSPASPSSDRRAPPRWSSGNRRCRR